MHTAINLDGDVHIDHHEQLVATASRRAPKYHRIVVVTLSALVLASCSGSDSDAGGSSGDDESAALTLRDDGSVGFSAEWALAYAADLGETPSEPTTLTEVLDDGNLTFAEYESQTQAAIDCASAGGVEVVSRGIDSSLGYDMVDYAIPADGTAVFDDCFFRHAEVVDYIWQDGHLPEGYEEDLKAANRKYVECVAENADVPIDVDAFASQEATQEQHDELGRIADKIADEGGVDCFEFLDAVLPG